MEHRSQQASDDIVSVLKRHGVLPTRQRIEIAQVLLSRHQHLTAEQVIAQVNTGSAGISKATVYNTLGLFAEHGLVKELVIDPGRIVYDSNPSDHHHFFNVDTGKLTDFTTSGFPRGNMPALPPGTAAIGVDVVIRIRNQAK